MPKPKQPAAKWHEEEDVESEEEEEDAHSSKFNKRLQQLKAKQTQNKPTTNTPAKIAAKLLEINEDEEEEEEAGEEAEGEAGEEGEEEEEEGEEEGEHNGEEGEEPEAEGEAEDDDEEADGMQTLTEGKKETTNAKKERKPSKQWAMYFDDDDEEEEKKEQKKTLTKEQLEKIKQDIENRGVVYLSSVPPNMNPEKMKHYFTTNFGAVTRIHLAKKGMKELKKYQEQTGHRSNHFYKEGWLEFKDKNVAKRVAACLSGTQLGGHGIEAKAVWNIRYLSKFKWSFLQEKLFNQKAEATKVMTQKLEEAKRDIETYKDQTERAKSLSNRAKKRLKEENAPIPQIEPHRKKQNGSKGPKRLPVHSQIMSAKRPKLESQ